MTKPKPFLETAHEKLMNIAIVDDDSINRLVLQKMISQINVESGGIFEYDSVDSAISGMQVNKPDLVLLDINLGDGSGFEILDFFDDRDFKVIFITGYDEFAVKAFKYSAIDYLVKPISLSELKVAFEKLGIKSIQNSQTEVAKKNIVSEKENPESIMLPITDGFEMIRIDNIIKIEANGNYSFLYLRNKEKKLVVKSIGYFEDILPVNSFYRVHHSAIINVNFIKQYRNGSGGSIILDNELKQVVSARKKEGFLKFLKEIYNK